MRGQPRVTILLLAVFATACGYGYVDGTYTEERPASELRAHGHINVDPCRSYPDRVALMRIVQERHPYPFAGTAMAWPDGREGFITQTAWQLESGRATRSSNGDVLWGWWPNVNYALTAWQLIALQRRGELSDVHAIEYLDGGRFDPSPEFEQAIDSYYADLDATRELAESGRLAASEVDDRQARLQQKLWHVHEAALDAALARNTDELERLPWAERRFARAWGYSLVSILTAMNFPTDDRFVQPINDLALPSRMVNTGDILNPFGSDLGAGQRAGVLGLVAIDEFENRTGGLVRKTVLEFATTAERSRQAAERFIALVRDRDLSGFISALGG